MLQRLIPASIFLTLLMAVSVFGPCIAEANNAPTTVGTMPNSTLMVGGSIEDIDVSTFFSDADQDPLTYTATSSDTTKATVSVADTVVTVTPVAAGTVTITVTATDPDSLSATQTYTLTVLPENASPYPTTPTQTLPSLSLKVNGTTTLNLDNSFTDPDGDALTYTASSADTTIATVGVSSATLTVTAVATGTTTITAIATDPGGLWSRLEGSVTVSTATQNRAPIKAFSIPAVTAVVGATATVDLNLGFSDPDGDTLTYTVTSSDTAVVTVSLSGSSATGTAVGVGTATLTATATDPGGLTATLSVNFTITASTADAVSTLSGQELLQLDALLTYDTVIFNELHNASDDANDWLELRNVSTTDLQLDDWELTIQTSSGNVIVSFPTGTVIPVGEVLLLANTAMATGDASVSTVIAQTFVLPQTDFTLILRSPTAFGDIAGNYFQNQKERPETAPELAVDTVWERIEATTSGYRAEAWAASTHRNGLGTPGYHPSAVAGDLNHDGIVNIQDLVLVASEFGTTGPSAADLNDDNTVNIQDLILIANALGNAAAAPSAKQSTAALVHTWLQLAQQNASDVVSTSLREGFSYARGIQTLEQLVEALTPDTTALFANYPNPFNPETWIPYQLSKAADVAITIYASDGNVVRTLALGHQDAGMYKNRSQAAYWDGKNEIGESVASGLYFYTLTAGNFSATRRMLILK